MRVTLSLDDRLLGMAEKYTELHEKLALVRKAGWPWAQLGGSARDLAKRRGPLRLEVILVAAGQPRSRFALLHLVNGLPQALVASRRTRRSRLGAPAGGRRCVKIDADQ